MVSGFKNSVQFMRDFGRANIRERLRALENNEYVPTDILSMVILNSFNNCSPDFLFKTNKTIQNEIIFCFKKQKMEKSPTNSSKIL